MRLTSKKRKELNAICNEYCGWKYPEELRTFWDRLSDEGIDILVTGYPDNISSEGRSKYWAINFDINGDDVVNSKFVLGIYEGNNSLKNEYLMYFS